MSILLRTLVASSLLFVCASSIGANQTFKITHMGTPDQGYVTLWIDSVFDCNGTNTSTLEVFFGGYHNNDEFTAFTVLFDAAKNSYNVTAVTDYMTAGAGGDYWYNSAHGGRCFFRTDSDSGHDAFMIEYP